MKHSAFSDCIVGICALTLTGATVSVACHDTPVALSPQIIECQAKVLDTYLGGNQDLENQVLRVAEGDARLEEFVAILVELYRTDGQIIDAGEAFTACLPKKVVAPVPDAGDKVL